MIPKYYEFYCPVKILAGRKALANLPYEVEQLGCSNPLIITDKILVGAGVLDKVKLAFADSGMKIKNVFDETPVDSSNRVINRVANIFRDKGCDCIIAVGGGSVLDTAKGVNIVVTMKTDDLLKYQGVGRVSGAMTPFIAVPTTAGTGSEVTDVAVILNEETGAKMSFVSNYLFPNVAVLDPTMMETMPPKITAATGMDALTHAVEAYTCLQKNPVSDGYAIAAIRLVAKYLIKAVKDGKNEEARTAMASAALLAGMAFSNSKVGMVHALAHATGGVAHVAHGVANSILLPYGMEYNIEKVPEYIGDIAGLLGEKTDGMDDTEKAYLAAAAVRKMTAELNKICGLPLTLSEAGVKMEQLQAIAKLALDDGSLTYNPAEMEFDEAFDLLNKAY